jgi:hypothetical protein
MICMLLGSSMGAPTTRTSDGGVVAAGAADGVAGGGWRAFHRAKRNAIERFAGAADEAAPDLAHHAGGPGLRTAPRREHVATDVDGVAQRVGREHARQVEREVQAIVAQ